jgi:hypothetical protein
MAKFFVGQRVKIVGATISKRLIGTETRIVGFTNCAWNGIEYYSGWETQAITDDGAKFVAMDGQLEPILPEGAQPSEFSFTEIMDNLGVVVA